MKSSKLAGSLMTVVLSLLVAFPALAQLN